MVFSAKSLRRLSSSVYVQAVLVSDTVFLLTLFALWLESFGYDAIHMNGICQSNIYLSYVGSFLSVWYVVCITIENYITICHPLKINKLCTFMRARVVTVSLAVASLFLFVVVIPITKPQGTGHMDPSDNNTESRDAIALSLCALPDCTSECNDADHTPVSAVYKLFELRA
ncbi:unnamed protein product [Acanthosepion pharaonis]|uniref:G-protein coupled receptors family 1 profile domain-containing protein n=1 Tax=Acanthosepion pharaonis TaxID=158019 RepID=A0A812BU98_ACAPH|nr:unnamed protein product [Sepia pharaonis]